MTFLGCAAACACAGATTSFLPTARRVDVRLFHDLSLATVVLKWVAILASVSPARTVYQTERTGFEETVLVVAVAERPLAAKGLGGVTPLIGMIKDWPTFRTGTFPRLLASDSWAVVVSY